MQNINHGSIHINTLVKISDLDYTVIQLSVSHRTNMTNMWLLRVGIT